MAARQPTRLRIGYFGSVLISLCQAVSWLPEYYPCHLGLTVTALVAYSLSIKYSVMQNI